MLGINCVQCHKVKTKCLILIISKRPLLCEGLKSLITEVAQATLITSADEEIAEFLCGGVAPDIIIFDRPNVEPYMPVRFLREYDNPINVVLLGWDDGKLATYSRERVMPATAQNLIKVIKELSSSK